MSDRFRHLGSAGTGIAVGVCTPERCPGPGAIPTSVVHNGARPRRVCRRCDREFALTAEGVVRVHRGLAKVDGYGCPYRCEPDCDFACYFSEASHG